MEVHNELLDQVENMDFFITWFYERQKRGC